MLYSYYHKRVLLLFSRHNYNRVSFALIDCRLRHYVGKCALLFVPVLSVSFTVHFLLVCKIWLCVLKLSYFKHSWNCTISVFNSFSVNPYLTFGEVELGTYKTRKNMEEHLLTNHKLPISQYELFQSCQRYSF